MKDIHFLRNAMNWVVLFKKRLMLFIMLFGIPISLSFLFGYSMQAKQIRHIPTIIVDRDNSALSRTIIQEIRDNEIFNVDIYSQKDSDVEKYIEEGKAMVGVIIPADFSKNLLEGKGQNVLVFYDGSQMSGISAAKARMTEILLTIKTGYLKQVMEGKLNILPGQSMKTVQPMFFTYRILNNPTRNYVNFYISGMLISVIQVGLVMIGADRVRDDEKYFIFHIIKALIWGLLGTISIIITLWIQVHYFGVPFLGTLKGALALTLLYSTAMISVGMISSLIIPNQVLATQVAAILVLPTSILGGFTFPLMAVPEFFQKLGSMIPYVHYAEPMRDLNMKAIGISYIANDIIWLGKFIIYIWVVSAVIFFAKKGVKFLWNKRKEKKLTIGNHSTEVGI